MEKVLITGGAGFIGSHVAQQCVKMGFRTFTLDDLSGGFVDNVPQGVEFIEGSINDHELVNQLFEEYKFEYVYHLAAYAAEGLSHFIRRFNYQNNLIGSVNLINASINAGTVKRFIFASSIAVYGAAQVPMSEETKPDPEDPYGISKYAVELDLRAAHEMFGLKYTIFRPHNVYGKNQNMGDRYRNVIGIFMNQIMQKKPMTIFGDGEQTRAFSHINDVAPIIANCINNDASTNEVFNIGAEQAYTVNALAQITARAFDVDANVRYLDARNEVVHALSDHSRIERVFGTQNYMSLEDGIGEMASWAKDKGPRESSIFSAIEVSKNMPPSWKAVMEKNQKDV